MREEGGGRQACRKWETLVPAVQDKSLLARQNYIHNRVYLAASEARGLAASQYGSFEGKMTLHKIKRTKDIKRSHIRQYIALEIIHCLDTFFKTRHCLEDKTLS